jgi:hypothetical protein
VTGRRPPVYVKEDAPWSAVRNAAHSYGFAAFTVDLESHRDGIGYQATYCDVVGPDGQLLPSKPSRCAAPRPRRLPCFMKVDFFDAGSVISTDGLDGIHFTAKNSVDLGRAIGSGANRGRSSPTRTQPGSASESVNQA